MLLLRTWPATTDRPAATPSQALYAIVTWLHRTAGASPSPRVGRTLRPVDAGDPPLQAGPHLQAALRGHRLLPHGRYRRCPAHITGGLRPPAAPATAPLLSSSRYAQAWT